jgi:inosose dehydratase
LNLFMASIQLAGGPVSWGVDFAADPANPPWQRVLDGIAGCGLTHAELGPVGYLPTGALATRGLTAVGTFVFDDFHADGADARLDAAVAGAVTAIAEAGGALLVLIDRPGGERAPTAGRSAAARRLDDRRWAALVARLRRAAGNAAAHGVRAVVHPHAGGFVEFEDEVDRLLDAVPAEEAGLCLDSGHVLYAGGDPAAAVQRWGARIEHVHLKDVAGEVLARGLGFWDAIAAGVSCPVGTGMLDLAALRDALAAIGYRGVATVEQDRRPGTPGDPVVDLASSVRRLRAARLG